MSAQTYEHLRAVPPRDEQKIRWAWLLQVRSAARRALSAALSVPRKAASFLGRLVQTGHLGRAVSRLRSTAARMARPALRLVGWLGRTGLVASVASVVTSPTGQAVVRTVGGWLGRGLGWLARKTYSLLDKGLRLFGHPGNKTADALFGLVVSVGGKLASIAAPVVHRVARLSDPQSTHVRLLSGLARGFALHRAMKAVITNPYLRMVVEGVVLPFLADSRVGVWVRSQIRTLRERAGHLREQSLSLRVVDGLGPQMAAEAPTSPASAPKAAGDHVPMPSWIGDLDNAQPSNRAERRAQQRQSKRPQRDQHDI